jgi:hypothetical protein
MPRRRCCVVLLAALLLSCCHLCAALLDLELEASAVARNARALPLILSPAPGSTVAFDGDVHVRIVVPALARDSCAHALALTLSVDDTGIASHPLPPPGPDPVHLTFVLDVASLHLQPGAHDLLVQLSDISGAALGGAATLEFHVQAPGDVERHAASSSPITSRSIADETLMCSASATSSWACVDDSGCNSAGSCVRGVCRCLPGWFGATCSVKPDNSSEYFPAVDPLRDSAVQCAETLRHAHVAAGLRELIGSWGQRQRDCGCFEAGSGDADSCPLVGSVPLYGLGAQIRHATRLLHTAVTERRPLVFVPERDVNGRMVSFAPCMPLPQWIGDAAPAHVHIDHGHAFNGWKSETSTPDNATAHGFPQHVVCVFAATHSCSPLLRLRATRQVQHLLPNSKLWRYMAPEHSDPPAEFAAAGMLTFRSELTAALLTPLPWFDVMMTARAASLGLVSPSLGVHLRRGDACVHAEWDPAFRPPCAQLQVYVDAALSMVQRYNPASVFVSSDDSAAAIEFEAALRAAGIRVPIVAPGVGDLYQGRTLLEERVGWENAAPADVAWTTLRDIFFLARSDYFVVNFASQLSRVAFELAVSRRSGLLPPYLSVDGFPWCDAPCKFGRQRQRAISQAIASRISSSPQC